MADQPRDPDAPLHGDVERIPPQRPSARPRSGARMSVTAAYFEGPLPPPAVLREYDALAPGSAERIIRLMEQQSHHRMELEKTAIQHDTRRANWGLASGTMLSIGVLVLCAYLVYTGNALTGVALVIAEIVALAGVFVYGTNSRRQERIEKVESLERQRAPKPPE